MGIGGGRFSCHARKTCWSIDEMRTEIANLVDEIKQSLGLLRRYL